jgi:hypothetical protein
MEKQYKDLNSLGNCLIIDDGADSLFQKVAKLLAT